MVTGILNKHKNMHDILYIEFPPPPTAIVILKVQYVKFCSIEVQRNTTLVSWKYLVV